MERTWREVHYHITFKDGTTESDVDYIELPVDHSAAEIEYQELMKWRSDEVDYVSLMESE